MADRSLEAFEADDGSCPVRAVRGAGAVIVQAPGPRRGVAAPTRPRDGLDLAGTEWLKALGEGLHEFRVRHTAVEIAEMFGGEPPEVAHPHEAVLLRVFVHFHGNRVVLLLAGYDKGADPSRKRQDREIARARKLLTPFKERQRRERAGRRRG